MSRLYKRQLTRIFYFLLTCGCIYIILKFLFKSTSDENISISNFENLQQFINQVEEINEQRITKVKETCEKYNLGFYKKDESSSQFKHPPAPQFTVFYIERSHNISYCPIYKAGSTTWIHNLCLLMGVSEDELSGGREQISTIARRVIPEMEYPEAEEALQETKKLLIVRHPFERLLSAYRDKLENSVAGREHGTLHFYEKYGKMIVQKYRDKNFATFQSNQVIRKIGTPAPAGIEPTWREFIDYLINTDLGSYADDHWMPYYLYCTPCLLNYDFIAKVETLWQDQIFTIHKLKLDKKIKPNWRHNNGQSNASRIYFSQLNKDMVQRLYKKFQLDFELFGYSPDEYYNYATSQL
ncbi:carbohydrate sulfotransferase 9-like [Leptopilina heterotoma]|uniref:carbohydrate sulfotransferase 9-like n=1 Tax=Leptopilina heterotoma TaxID=63436 RepID=UPI001CAA195B|nr:carbohydrate sulfotransferase 9-like [Leptopilina heterotoma]